MSKELHSGSDHGLDTNNKTGRFIDVLTIPVFVAGLGYFVDMFALTLFGAVRQQSVAALGITNAAEALLIGKSLYNLQMIGMMVGGLIWGLMGDYLGRLSVLFGSILIYSLGSIANAFVTTPEQYELCRFLTGLGLAGELGAAITLVTEILPKNARGLGTTVVATLGLAGAVSASLLGLYQMRWDHAYILSGVMGLALLFTRFKVFESGMFEKVKSEEDKGKLSSLVRVFKPFLTIIFSHRILKYLACIFIGAPIYFITGTLMTFAPEITQGLGIQGVSAAQTLLWGTIGLTAGDFFSGILSQTMKSRRGAVFVCLSSAFLLTLCYMLISGLQPIHIYILAGFIGLFAGYWAVLVTMTAEQFGTNLRATATTTAPNFVRGAGALFLQLFVFLKGYIPTQQAAISLTIFVFGLAFLSTYYLKESFSKDLDYTE